MSEIKPLVSPWVPESNPKRLKILGKALEEAGEYTSAVSRCLVQGIDESEPVTGKPNKQWLEEELADLLGTAAHVIEEFELDDEFMEERSLKKYLQLKTWHSMPV